jgi:gliding motility-associated-like protein
MGLLRALPILILTALHLNISAQVSGKRPMSLLEERNINFFSLVKDSSWNRSGKKTSTLPTERIASSPFDTCATYTYRLKIGTDNSNEEVSDITVLRSGGVLVTGKTNNNNQQDDALLIRLDANGSVLWLKTYGLSDRREIFYKARETSDGGIITIGSVFGPVAGEGYILICKLDGNGNLQWTNKYRSSTNSFAEGADIIELTEGNFAFIGDDRIKLLYGKLSVSGTLLWNREVKLSDSTRAINITENNYEDIEIATTGMDTGWHVSNLIDVTRSNGNLVWRKRLGGSVTQSHYIFQKMVYTDPLPRITGIYAANGQPYQFIRLTSHGMAGFGATEHYTIPGVTVDATSTLVMTTWAEALAFSPGSNSNSISIFQHIPDVDQIPWAYSYISVSNLQLTAIEKTKDGGFLAACNITNNSTRDILLIKVDSVGLSPGCEQNSIIVSDTLMPLSISEAPIASTVNSLSVDNNPITTNTIFLDSVYYCRQLTCPIQPAEDTCLATFTKHYRSYEFAEVPGPASMTNDDHIILSGLHRDIPYDPSSQTFFMIKTDNKGNLVAKKRFRVGQNSSLFSQIKLADNNIMVVGFFLQSSTAYGIFLMKLDNDLNVIWKKNYSVTQPSWGFKSISEAADGSLFISMTYHDFATMNDRMVLTKLDNAGNFLWQKIYRPPEAMSLFGNWGGTVCLLQDIYFSSQIFYDVEQKWKAMVTKIDQATGNILWNKMYSYPGQETALSGGTKMSGNSFLMRAYIDAPGQNGPVLIKMDGDGNILHSIMHNHPTGSILSSSTLANNSDIILSGSFSGYWVSEAYYTFVRLDSNLNIKYSKRSPMFVSTGSAGIVEDQQGFVYVFGSNGYNNSYNADISLKKYTYDGMSGTCPSDTFIFQQSVPLLNVINRPLNTTTGAAFPIVDIPFSEFDFSLQQNGVFCGSVSGCDTLWLNGPPAITCDSSSAIIIYANKNPGCHASVNWIVNPSEVEVQQRTDSLIRIRLLQNATVTIRAQLLTGCRVFEDSIKIVANLSPKLRLGPDTVLCPNNSLVLNARSGFQTYLWQDNSTDSIFLVTSPGNYFVETTDACGNVFKDTVVVAPAPPIPFNIGPDLIKCNSDSLVLTSPPGFLNYTWGPAYNINQMTGQSVIVFPTVDTSYMIKAEKAPGCFAYDTVHITVHQSLSINLGADTSFCVGNSVTLNAGTGFQTYTWSTGANTQQIQVQSAGTYSILAIITEGCKSYDTLRVVNVFNKPRVNLIDDSLLCANINRILDPGPGFKTYLWSNGSSGQTMTINSAGTYWVLVTDLHGCSNSDTTVITRTLTPPSGFLPPDTSLCRYSSLLLQPGSSFSSYLWSNGFTGNAITVTQPGAYWLQVSDNYDCKGRDSILVLPKQCMEGFYIPNAFTPNNDGNNDIFRPLLFGIVAKYKFKVYNRWGEKVFETSSLQNGWDGKVKGISTDANVFVWQCSYQFQGQKEEFRKGTFVLIR